MSLIKAPSCLLIWIWFPLLNQNYVPETPSLLLIWIMSLIEAPFTSINLNYVPNWNNYHAYNLALDFYWETKLYPWRYSIGIVRIKSSRALRPWPMFNPGKDSKYDVTSELENWVLLHCTSHLWTAKMV